MQNSKGSAAAMASSHLQRSNQEEQSWRENPYAELLEIYSTVNMFILGNKEETGKMKTNLKETKKI